MNADRLNVCIYYVRQGYGVEVSRYMTENMSDESIALSAQALQLLGFTMKTVEEAEAFLEKIRVMELDESFTPPF